MSLNEFQNVDHARREIPSGPWTRLTKLSYYLWQRCRYQCKGIRFRKLAWKSLDQKLKDAFDSNSLSDQDRYSELFSYLVTGLLYYRSSDYSHVYYPGASSSHGADIDAMEGLCRTLPMISAWIVSGRSTVFQCADGQQIDLMEVIGTALLSGTNPRSIGYWGNIGERDQRIVEAADIALAVWLLRDRLWPRFSQSEKVMIFKWLLSVNGKMIPDNNWHLFPVMVNEVLSSLGCPYDSTSSRLHYLRLKSFYMGNGWFTDGPDGEIDYYNAWSVHYFLFWLNLINPKLDPDFLDRSLEDFVKNYKYFFSTDGIPITGRSICYRMAAPAPLIAASINGMNSISPGLARRALHCIWKYFIGKGAVQRGRITQGYWQDDLALLDNYSGPGSSLWSTRSLTLAFYNPPYSKFWTAALEDLPIEQYNYEVLIPEIRWKIQGFKLNKEVQLIKTTKSGIIGKGAKQLSPLHRFFVFALGLPYRLQNNYACNDLSQYSSLRPFWITDKMSDHAGTENDSLCNT